MKDKMFEIAGTKIESRLFVGTGKFPNKSVIKEVLEKSRARLVTVALRRVDLDAAESEDNILNHIPKSCILVTNTSGARNAHEAVRIARLAKAGGCGSWIKLEIINDNKYLLPDNEETIKAIEILAKEGFILLPYMMPDLVSAQKMVKAGAHAVMPLGSPIGSNRGVKMEEMIKIMINEINVPVIVDAGIGKPSHASLCMEFGADAVLVNTAIATAKDPVNMAKAFSLAVEAGRMAYLSGMGRVLDEAEASSPLTGFLR